MNGLPLEGITVLEFCQYLAGPSAGLRLADLGARVIKIERPGMGEAGRKLAIRDAWVDTDSLLFHTINRNKESYTANLKDPAELEGVKKLLAKADVLIHNFRPEVMERNSLGYAAVRAINNGIVYAEISGYGKKGPWKDKPGQDLLLQSMAGLTYTTGNGNKGPVPFGISIADIMAGSQLVQGILGALIRRQKTGQGALIEVSLLESLLDFQFELLTTYFTTGKQPQRSLVANGQPLLSAPYGIYKTAAGYIAIAMMDIKLLARAIGCTDLMAFSGEDSFARRDEIKSLLAAHLLKQPADFWLELLHEAGLWAMPVLNWDEMTGSEAYEALGMEQTLNTPAGKEIITTRCPIRLNGKRLTSKRTAPGVGENTERIREEVKMRNEL